MHINFKNIAQKASDTSFSLLSICYLHWHPYLSIPMLLSCLYYLYSCVLYTSKHFRLKIWLYLNQSLFFHCSSFWWRKTVWIYKKCRVIIDAVNGLTCSLMQAVFRAWIWGSISCKKCLGLGSVEVITLWQLWFHVWIIPFLYSKFV